MDAIKQAIWAKSDGRCYYCGEPLGEYWHAEHMHPKSQGGRRTLENMVVSCPTCNSRKHCHTVEEYRHTLKMRVTREIGRAVHVYAVLMFPYISQADRDQITQAFDKFLAKIENAEIVFWGEK